MFMFLYLVLMWAGILVISIVEEPGLLMRTDPKQDPKELLNKLNKNCKKSLRLCYLWLAITALPFIDFLIVEFSEEYFPPYNFGNGAWRDYNSNCKLGDSPIFGIDFVDIIPSLVVLSTFILIVGYIYLLVGYRNKIKYKNAELVEEKIQKVNSYTQKAKELEEKYGRIIKTVHLKRVFGNVLDTTDIENQIIIFSDQKHIFIKQNMYVIDQLLDWHYQDNPSYKTSGNSSTSHNIGSTIGRAAIGGIIVGPIGAIVGGTTGKTTTETNISTEIEHNYSIIINTIDINNPVIDIHIGKDEKLVNEIIGTLNILKKTNK